MQRELRNYTRNYSELKKKKSNPMMAAKDLSIIIVTYNSAEVIPHCLKSVLTPDNLSKEIFVIDNASKDQTVTVIRKGFPSVNLTVNKINKGFGAANNQVIDACSGEVLLFLNPDTVVRPDCLERVCSFIKTNQ